MRLYLRNVNKHYEGYKDNQALIDVSFKIEPHEKIVTVIGRSGSGKSTLLNLIAALDSPDSGEIYVGEQNLAKLNRDQLANYRLHNIGIVFQFFNLFPTLTLFENIAVPGYLSKIPDKILERKVEGIAEQIGIGHLLKKYPHEVSGGEAQRTAICRALINTPKLLLADEPTGNLDTETSKVIVQLLKNLVDEQKLTLIIVTHDTNLIQNIDKTIELRNGRVII